MAKNFYLHIEGLRGIAVLSVIFMHLGFVNFEGGFIGVDIFFVISGFLISKMIINEINETNRFSLITFYFRRTMRILPALFFVLLLTFIAGVVFFNQAKFQALGRSIAAAALSCSNIYFYYQAGYFDVLSQSNPLLHTWSLGVEEQFYLVWPFLLLAAYKFFKVRGWLVAITIVFFLSFIINLNYQHSNLSVLYYFSPARAFEFCIGAFIACVGLKEKTKSVVIRDEIACLIGLLLIGWAIVTFNKTTIFPTYNALIPAVGTGLIIYYGNARYAQYFFGNQFLRFFGLISYSAYLIHWPLIVFTKTYNELLYNNYQLTEWNKYQIIMATFILAYLCYRFIETPFRKRAALISRGEYSFTRKRYYKSNNLTISSGMTNNE